MNNLSLKPVTWGAQDAQSTQSPRKSTSRDYVYVDEAQRLHEIAQDLNALSADKLAAFSKSLHGMHKDMLEDMHTGDARCLDASFLPTFERLSSTIIQVQTWTFGTIRDITKRLKDLSARVDHLVDEDKKHKGGK